MRGGRIWRQTQSKGRTYTNPPPGQHLTHARRLTTVIFFFQINPALVSLYQLSYTAFISPNIA